MPLLIATRCSEILVLTPLPMRGGVKPVEDKDQTSDWVIEARRRLAQKRRKNQKRRQLRFGRSGRKLDWRAR